MTRHISHQQLAACIVLAAMLFWFGILGHGSQLSRSSGKLFYGVALLTYLWMVIGAKRPASQDHAVVLQVGYGVLAAVTVASVWAVRSVAGYVLAAIAGVVLATAVNWYAREVTD